MRDFTGLNMMGVVLILGEEKLTSLSSTAPPRAIRESFFMMLVRVSWGYALSER